MIQHKCVYEYNMHVEENQAGSLRSNTNSIGAKWLKLYFLSFIYLTTLSAESTEKKETEWSTCKNISFWENKVKGCDSAYTTALQPTSILYRNSRVTHAMSFYKFP